MGGPSTAGEVLGAESDIRTAIDGPKYRFAQNRALAAGTSDIRNKKPRLPRQALNRMSRKGKIQDGNAFDSKCTAIDLRIASHIHYYLVCVELPLGMGQFAGRDGAIVDTIMVGPGLLDHFSSEIERARRSQH